MKVSVLILLFFTINISHSKSQIDCEYTYTYKGKIIKQNTDNKSVIKIILPSDRTFLLAKNKDWKKLNYADTVLIKKDETEFEFSNVFVYGCPKGPPFLSSIFIKGKTFYSLKIITEHKETKLKINIEDIKFILSGKKIVIEFPPLKI